MTAKKEKDPEDNWFMPMKWGSYFKDTMDLKPEDHGLYLPLIGHLWQAGGSLRDDDTDIAFLLRCTRARWRKCKAKLGKRLIIENGMIRQSGVTETIEKVVKIRTIRSEVGTYGNDVKYGRIEGKKPLENNKTPVANGVAKPSQTGSQMGSQNAPILKPKDYKEDPPPKSSPPDLDPDPAKKDAENRARALLPRILVAVGLDENPPKKGFWSEARAVPHVAEWCAGLSDDRILQIAAESREGHTEPPQGPKALDSRVAGEMQRSAVRSRADPAAPLDAMGAKEAFLRQVAVRLNTGAYVPQTSLSNADMDFLLKNELTNVENLKKQGFYP